MTTNRTRWTRLAAGLYQFKGQKATYEAERQDRNDYEPYRGERERWLLRVDNEVTDASETLAELKILVAQYEQEPTSAGKPLIEILD